jgi:peptidoglycan-N-acetylglucosamine deacetylase
VEWSEKMADLDQELEGLRAAADTHAARYQVIEDCRWPAGARIAVNVTADFDAMLLRRLLNEPALQLAKGEFGGRVGIWRLLELFASHDIKATIFTPGRICELYPDAVRASAAGGHEVADHMWEHRVPAERALEEGHLKLALDALEKLAGKRPVGSRSHHTLSVLRAEGVIYHSNRVQDHRPHWVRDPDSEKRMLNLPFHYAIDDAMYYSFAWLNTEIAAQRITDPERVEDMWWDAFRQQYEVGGYLNICLHPFVSGRAQRIAMMDRLFTRMKRLPGVWFPTCETVARHLIAATTQAA